jgi:hypothetical protein
MKRNNSTDGLNKHYNKSGIYNNTNIIQSTGTVTEPSVMYSMDS